MGADAIGLVFAESPRQVSSEQACAITDALPPLTTTIGIFVDSDAETVNRAAAKANLTIAQLHGHEAPEIVEHLSIPCIKAFRVRDDHWIDEVIRWLEGVRSTQQVKAILLDAYVSGVAGGTGEQFNWQWVAEARAAGKLDGLPPLVLSGGLDAENVSEAIQTVQPWMVDVSSGVESSPGVKDLKKVQAFIDAIKQ
jgi:phosphoribosylanthranilate isomerase